VSDKYCTAPLKGTASGIEDNADSKQAMIACLGERDDSGERPGRFTRGPTRARKGLAALAGTESLHGPGYVGCLTLYGECHPHIIDGRRIGLGLCGHALLGGWRHGQECASGLAVRLVGPDEIISRY